MVWSICWDLAFGEGRSRDGGSEPIVWLWLDRARERERVLEMIGFFGVGEGFAFCRGGRAKYCYCRYFFTR